MKRIAVSEFREHADDYLAGDEVVTVERQGRTVGVYIPFQPTPSRATSQELMARLEKAIAYALEVNHMTEDELADLLDLSKPA